jgi:hypothetical protein
VKNWVAWLVASASGAALWIFSNLREGTQEPWDVPAYWSIYLPFAAALCFVLGLAFPEKPWRWPLAVMFAQLPVMIAFTGEAGPLIVIGIGLLVFNSLLGIPFAWLGAFVRRRLAT